MLQPKLADPLSCLLGVRAGDGGHLFVLQASLSGEVFGDFVASAKAALNEGHHSVAAVLACAALEDALKRLAKLNGLSVDGQTMEDVVNALKSSPWGVFTIAMTIPIALLMGLYLRRLRPGKVLETSTLGFVLVMLAIFGA